MTKKREIAVSDDNTLDAPTSAPETLKSTSSVVNTPALQALLDSGIITIVDGGLIWREGHLEHLAREWAADPMGCEYNYRNELEVARQYGIEL